MILLDTNICTYFISAKPPKVLAGFRQYSLGEVRLCSVVAAELAHGVAKSRSAPNKAMLEMFLAPLEILPFDTKALWPYGDLLANLERQGQPIDALNTITAAHALSVNAPLGTHNTREFERIAGLRLENWVQP